LDAASVQILRFYHGTLVLVSTIAGHRHFHAWHLHDLAGGTT
jgi:hypothetical protein